MASNSSRRQQKSSEDVSGLTIEDIKVDLIRYYPQLAVGKELGRVTLREAVRLFKAAKLRRLDEERSIHLLAWKQRAAASVVDKGPKKGYYTYQTFEQFFSESARKAELLGETPEQPMNTNKTNLLELVAKANSTKGGS